MQKPDNDSASFPVLIFLIKKNLVCFSHLVAWLLSEPGDVYFTCLNIYLKCLLTSTSVLYLTISFIGSKNKMYFHGCLILISCFKFF